MIKPRIIRNRRAEVPDFISDVFSFFLYLLAFLCFFILFTLSFGGCDKLESQSQTILAEAADNVADEQFMLNYMRTNLTLDGRQATYAELLAESCVNGNYVLIKEKTAEFMDGGVKLAIMPKLVLRCDPERRRTVEIYEPTRPSGCPYTLVCTSDKTDYIAIPLPYVEGMPGYATLEMDTCTYYKPHTGASASIPMPIDSNSPELKAAGCLA